MHGCQTGVTTKVGSHLHVRYEQMKDMRPFEEIDSEKISELMGQRRASQSRAGTRDQREQSCKQRGGLTTRFPLQQADSHFQMNERTAERQFHIYQGADQLILYHKNTLPGGVKNEEMTPGHITARFDIPDGQVKVQEAA